MEIIIGEQKGKAILLEENAPQTCNIIWDKLPLEGDLHYAKIAGKEVYTIVPILLRPPIEKGMSTTTLDLGSIIYYPNRQMLCIFYGPTKETVEVLVIAKIIENLEGLIKEMDKVKVKQGMKVLFRKAC